MDRRMATAMTEQRLFGRLITMRHCYCRCLSCRSVVVSGYAWVVVGWCHTERVECRSSERTRQTCQDHCFVAVRLSAAWHDQWLPTSRCRRWLLIFPSLCWFRIWFIVFSRILLCAAASIQMYFFFGGGGKWWGANSIWGRNFIRRQIDRDSLIFRLGIFFIGGGLSRAPFPTRDRRHWLCGRPNRPHCGFTRPSVRPSVRLSVCMSVSCGLVTQIQNVYKNQNCCEGSSGQEQHSCQLSVQKVEGEKIAQL